MAGIKAPYRNKMKTPAKVIGRIAIDIYKALSRTQTSFNSNSYTGGSVTIPDPDGYKHDVLSLSHEDSDPDAPVLGDIITAQGKPTPLWTRLPKGTEGQVLTMVGPDDPGWADASTVTSVGPTSVDVGEQVAIDCGAVLTDALNSFVTLCCQNVANGAVFPALQSMARVAGRITYNWLVELGHLIVRVYNDSEVDTNVMVWYIMA